MPTSQDSGPQPGKTLSVVCYIGAGFFFFTVMMLAFVDQPIEKVGGIMGVFLVPALIGLLLGYTSSGFEAWRRDTGVVLLSSTAFIVSMVWSVISMQAYPEFMQSIEPEQLDFFDNYSFGFGVTGAVAAIGALFLVMSYHSDEPPMRGTKKRHGTPQADDPVSQDRA